MRVNCPACNAPFYTDERNRYPVIDCACGETYHVVVPLSNGHRMLHQAYTVLSREADNVQS